MQLARHLRTSQPDEKSEAAGDERDDQRQRDAVGEMKPLLRQNRQPMKKNPKQNPRKNKEEDRGETAQEIEPDQAKADDPERNQDTA